ncbi:OLC1v1032855C1 [Oldenlandia corymbosa var. corymbosa]|uniref:OLC1v1032855C1 n=1 Tax=Oldenlandia corymbosa var. corymbosa TaxID=529605 RepID=A0AAV1CQ71_OLDCO|nr:OLC1v1032855C1 [Oldenlandia corymbosa var. corymbosa]
MSQVFDFSGDSEFFMGGSMYPNPKDSSLLLSLGHHVGVYFPPSKRSRVNAPFVFREGRFVQKRPSIDVLPDECLFEVFRRLPGGQEKSACACVSKRWLTLLSSIRADEICSNTGDVKSAESEVVPVVQKPSEIVDLKKEDESVDVSLDVIADDGAMMDDGHLSRCLEGKKATDVRLAAIAIGIARRGGLGELSIRGSNTRRGVTDFGLKAIAHGCPSLRDLSLWNLSAISDEGLIAIANECHRLEKLDLCECPAVTDKALLAIAQNCPNLTSLNIESCANIGNGSLEAVARFCHNLKSIAIKNCARVGDNGVASLFLKPDGNVLTKARFESLSISDMSLAVIGRYGNALSDLSLVNLQNVNERGFWVMGNCRGLSNLRSISVTACQGFTDVGLEAVAKGSPSLKRVSLQKCAFVSDNGLASFAKAAASVEVLQLDECHRISPAGFLGLLLQCGKKMKSLSVANCLGFKDLPLGLDYNLAPCSSLKSLCVRNCPGFGNGCLSVLAKLCPNLEHVELTGLGDVTDEGILPLVENSEAGFVKVNLSGCMQLTDKVTSAIAKHHGGTLEELNLDGCKSMTDASLFAISEHCCLLHELGVASTKITDKGIAALAEAVQLSLQVLSLSGCICLSNRSLPSLKKLGQNLVGLNIKHCRRLSSNAVGLLSEILFKCDILF